MARERPAWMGPVLVILGLVIWYAGSQGQGQLAPILGLVVIVVGAALTVQWFLRRRRGA